MWTLVDNRCRTGYCVVDGAKWVKKRLSDAAISSFFFYLPLFCEGESLFSHHQVLCHDKQLLPTEGNHMFCACVKTHAALLGSSSNLNALAAFCDVTR